VALSLACACAKTLDLSFAFFLSLVLSVPEESAPEQGVRAFFRLAEPLHGFAARQLAGRAARLDVGRVCLRVARPCSG
jgi:hypothetical protein